MASVLQALQAVTPDGKLTNYLRDWLNALVRDISDVREGLPPSGTDTQTLRYNGTTLEATSDFVILASGDVGIGAAGTNGRKLRVLGDTNANAYVTIVNSLANGTATLGFGDPEDDNIGYVQYANVNNSMSIGTNGTAKQVIDSAGRSSFQNGTGNALLIEPGRASGVADAIWSNATATPLQIGLFNASNTANVDLYSQGTGDFRFINGGTVSMTVDANNDVGIGETSPTSKLTIRKDGTSTSQLELGATTGFRYELGRKSVGGLFRLYGQQSGFSGYIFDSVDGEFMRIPNSGNVLVGYTSSNGSYKLQVNSQIFATNSTIATSDARFKENVLDISTGMDVVAALRPVSFDWKRGEGHNFVTHRDVGFIAQEAESALAGKEYIQGVVKDVGAFKGMAYDKLVPILVKALQEQQVEMQALRARIEALEV